MAYLEITFHNGRFEIFSQAFYCDIHDTWENRKAWFVVLRSVCSPKTGKPLFSYQRIADGFGYKARQNIHNYVREYEQCDENLFDYLRHKRKVDPVVVDAVRHELGKDVLANTNALRIGVNQHLGREDLSTDNIRAALDQIPCSIVRKTVLRDLAHGSLHPKEAVVLTELFTMVEQAKVNGTKSAVGTCAIRPLPALSEPTAFDHLGAPAETRAEGAEVGERIFSGRLEACVDSGTLLRSAEMVSAGGIEAIREEPDEAIIQKIQADSIRKLLSPEYALSEIPPVVVQMVQAMAMYFSGTSLSRIGYWFGGKAKSTMYTWIIGLALGLWPVIRGWVWSQVKGTRQYVDEKWLKIRKTWHYLFVSVDQESGIAVFHELLPTRTKWACRLFLLKLKRLGKIPMVIITDGLQGYGRAIAAVFPTAKHLLCLFHHQQSVIRCVNTQFRETEQEEAKTAKKQMKRVVQTHDPRTVTRRLDRLEQTATEKGWKIMDWLTRTREKLKHLLPALRSNTYPSTTNEIERFFRAFSRFYKMRCGFHSVKSAKREIIFFMVVYLFTIQAERGTAPIENILPEANTMPFYRVLNYPFASELTSHSPPQNVKPVEDMATEQGEEVA
jgi:transposase-like protein